jgi:hypothetical protein
MELAGHVLSTGGGDIKVLDGYGRIVINNQLPYDLVLNQVDAGADVQGDCASLIAQGRLGDPVQQ